MRCAAPALALAVTPAPPCLLPSISAGSVDSAAPTAAWLTASLRPLMAMATTTLATDLISALVPTRLPLPPAGVAVRQRVTRRKTPPPPPLPTPPPLPAFTARRRGRRPRLPPELAPLTRRLCLSFTACSPELHRLCLPPELARRLCRPPAAASLRLPRSRSASAWASVAACSRSASSPVRVASSACRELHSRPHNGARAPCADAGSVWGRRGRRGIRGQSQCTTTRRVWAWWTGGRIAPQGARLPIAHAARAKPTSRIVERAWPTLTAALTWRMTPWRKSQPWTLMQNRTRVSRKWCGCSQGRRSRRNTSVTS
mmetsp:Transcript_53395/g.147450  ORF Transcript_53395/g.147450 Transcript_53395/m.147450 type:complete len:314 (-) Transcript_53395:715-1656(-)